MSKLLRVSCRICQQIIALWPFLQKFNDASEWNYNYCNFCVLDSSKSWVMRLMMMMVESTWNMQQEIQLKFKKLFCQSVFLVYSHELSGGDVEGEKKIAKIFMHTFSIMNNIQQMHAERYMKLLNNIGMRWQFRAI